MIAKSLANTASQASKENQKFEIGIKKVDFRHVYKNSHVCSKLTIIYVEIVVLKSLFSISYI